MSVLAFDRVGIRYGAHRALSEFSLNLAPGEAVALIGGTGSGKSSASLAALGLLHAGASLEGTVRREGRVAMIFQEPLLALNPLMTIGAQVAEAVTARHAMKHRAAAAEAARLLAEVGLDPTAIPPQRYPHELSGGQRQRVAIAIALASEPAVLIADEPTTALDPETATQVMALVARLVRERHMALLLVTHDLDLARGIADRIVLLDHGHVIETGPLPAILEAPRTAALLERMHHRPQRRRSQPDTPPVLQAIGLQHGYGARTVIAGVNLALHAGQIVGLVGSSGEGKSTLLRLVLGLEHPQHGQVLIDGHDLHKARGADLRGLRRKVQAVFQDPGASLDPRWRVGRIVAEPLGLLEPRLPPAERDARVCAVLARVGLPEDAASRLPGAFSGGQRQRIALARALVVEPEVIVLDEATSALDAHVRAEILDLIASLADEGLAFLFVTHDRSMIEGLADRLYRLSAGKLIAQDLPPRAPREP